MVKVVSNWKHGEKNPQGFKMKAHLHDRKLPNLSGKKKSFHYFLWPSGNLGKKCGKTQIAINDITCFEESFP